MNSKKTTKKAIKPAFTIDLTDCETIEDFYLAMIDAKLEANLQINKVEFEIAIQNAIDEAVDTTVNELLTDLFGEHNALVLEGDEIIALDAERVEKKPNIFKRFWNWATK